MKAEVDHKKINELVAQSVILLERQYLLVEHLIQTSGKSLRQFEIAVAKDKQVLGHVLGVYNYVLSLIDHLVRYQKISHMIPRLNKKDPSYRALDEAMGELKDDIRHTIQHIDREVDNDYTGPLLGAICWVSGYKQYLISFHDVGRKRSSPGIILDTHTNKFLHTFCFIYNEKYYELNKAIEGMRVFHQYIRSAVEIKIDDKPYNPTGDFTAVCFNFENTISIKTKSKRKSKSA